jgi:hypothetical protein
VITAMKSKTASVGRRDLAASDADEKNRTWLAGS